MSEQVVLVVEDEENLLKAIKYNLEKDGYKVQSAMDGEQGLELARRLEPSMIILDIMLPKLDGIEVCRILRRESNVPILMLTAKSEEIDRVVGLELGADDYVTKPFSMRELLARTKAILRRYSLSASDNAKDSGKVLKAGKLEVNISKHVVTLDSETLELKPREFDLLALLVENAGRALTRDQILESIWGRDYYGDTRTVDVHIRWLREKIEGDPGSPKRIITIRGVGYRFDPCGS